MYYKESRTPHSKYATQNKSLTFSMVITTENSKFSFNHFVGSTKDDSAPYSGLGMHELKNPFPSFTQKLEW